MSEVRAARAEQVWLDGRLQPVDTARIDPRDRGLLYGEALFETLRAYGGRPHALDAHLARLGAAMARLGWSARLDRDAVARAVAAVLEGNGLGGGDAAVRLTVTAGPDTTGAGVDAPPPVACVLLVRAREVERREAPRALTVGLANPAFARSLAALKTTHYVAVRLARQEARARGFEDALLTSPDGRVLEATTANVLVRFGDTLVTPADDGHLLAGVTRDEVLARARDEGLRTEQRALRVAELADAAEVLLTGSVTEVAAVTAVEGRPVGDGRVGPWAQRLFARYRAAALGR